MRYYCCYGKTLLSMSAVSQKARLKLLSTGDYWRRHGLRMRSINHDFKHSQYIFASETQQLALSIDFDGHKCVFCISFLEGPLHALNVCFDLCAGHDDMDEAKSWFLSKTAILDCFNALVVVSVILKCMWFDCSVRSLVDAMLCG